MAKNNTRTGTLVVSAIAPVTLDGAVTVNDAGVSIHAREFGRQTRIEQFFPWNQVLAYSDEGDGFVVVQQEQEQAVFNGSIETASDGSVSVTTEGGRVITSGSHPGASIKVVYDGEDGPTTVVGKEGRRRSARLDNKTAKAASSEKSASKKKKDSGKRR